MFEKKFEFWTEATSTGTRCPVEMLGAGKGNSSEEKDGKVQHGHGGDARLVRGERAEVRWLNVTNSRHATQRKLRLESIRSTIALADLPRRQCALSAPGRILPVDPVLS